MSRAPDPAGPQPPPTSTEQVLEQHRDALKQRFPMPGPELLQRKRGGRPVKALLPVLLVAAGALLLMAPAPAAARRIRPARRLWSVRRRSMSILLM